MRRPSISRKRLFSFLSFFFFFLVRLEKLGFPGGSDGKESARNVGDLGSIRGWEYALEESMAIHSSYFCLENPLDRGVWQATVNGVTNSRTRQSNYALREIRIQIWRKPKTQNLNRRKPMRG